LCFLSDYKMDMNKHVFLFVVFLCLLSSCTVEITLPGEPIYVNSIAITNKINDISIEKEYQLMAAYYPWDASGFDKFSWQSSDDAIATINQNGLLTTVEEGEVTIKLISKVTVKKGVKELTDEVTIHVGPILIENIQLDKDYLEIQNRSTDTLKVTFLPAKAKPEAIEWSSEDVAIATVVNGVVTGKSAGNTRITAQVKGTTIKAVCSVIVYPIAVTGMQFEEEIVQLESGFSFKTKLIIEPDSAENKRVTHTTSNRNIAEVDTNGVITAHYYHPNGIGNGPVRATVTATSVDKPGVKATCTVDVYSVPDLLSISIEKEGLTTDLMPTALGLKGSIKPTLHNNSSKPVHIVHFRILDRYDNIKTNIRIEKELKENSNYTIDWLTFDLTEIPRAVFRYEYEGKVYTSSLLIQQ